MKRITVRDLVASAVILISLAAAFAPVMATVQRSAAEARCQSNMRRWAQAIDLYVRDFQGTYPTNRAWSPGGVPSVILDQINLSDAVDENGNPVYFQYGINWVEALYPYIKRAASRTGEDWQSFRRCPNGADTAWPTTSTTACMSYAFNFCLLEQPVGILKTAADLMMFREMDRKVASMCRPSNDVTGTDAAPPKTPFLNTYDWRIKETNPNLHANGSYIVFADGHVRWFSTDYFPPDNAYSNRALHWDAQTQRWYNWVYLNPANDTERALDRSIAISP